MSISTSTFSDAVHSTRSLLTISMSGSSVMSPALIGPDLVTLSFKNLGSSLCITTTSCFKFSTTSVTSSTTPGMFESSCKTPLMRTADTAAP